MTIREFIRDKYPIKEKVAAIKNDPIKQIFEQDDLPCDAVMYIDGTMQKVVYVSDDEYIPVIDLLSYYEDEVRKMNDEAFKSTYFAYMDNVNVSNLTIESIMSASREYTKKKKQREELLKKCTQ